jgi:chemotaxis protein CheX
MSITQALGEPTIRANITRALTDVLKVMLKAQVEPVEVRGIGPRGAVPPEIVAALAGPHVVGSVGFIGDINGLIYLYLPLQFARFATGHLLGLSELELAHADEGAVTDAVGEITNMTVGSFKNALCDAGFPCALTIPSIITGSAISVEPIGSAERCLYNFECSGHRILVAVLMKTNE